MAKAIFFSPTTDQLSFLWYGVHIKLSFIPDILKKIQIF